MSSLIACCVSSSMGRETLLLSCGFIREKPICFLHLGWLLELQQLLSVHKEPIPVPFPISLGPRPSPVFLIPCVFSSPFKVFHYLSGTCYHHVLFYFLYKSSEYLSCWRFFTLIYLLFNWLNH